MSLVRNLVSQVRSSPKLISADTIISDRVILDLLRTGNIKFVVQRLDTRQGWTDPNLFSLFSCIPLKDVPIAECCDVELDCKISRSVNKLPKIIGTKFNLAIQGVWGINRKSRFIESNPNRYANSVKLNNKKEYKFFWILNDYLYLSKSGIELASMSAFTEQFVDPSLYSCDADKSKCPINPLDLEFKTLKGLEDDVVTYTTQKIFERYFNANVDKTTNNIDEQSR